MRTVTVLLIILVLILGGLAWNRHAAVQGLAAETHALQIRNGDLTREVQDLRRRQRENLVDALERASAPPKPAQPAASPFDGPLGDLKLLAEATKRGVVRPPSYFSSFGPADRLAVTFIKTFALTPDEVAGLKSHMVEAQAKVDVLTKANTTAARGADGAFVITVKPTSDGAGIHDSLLAAYRQTLGEERYQHFLQLAGSQFETCFGYFGAQERTITIKRNAAGPEEFMVEEHSKAVTTNAGGIGRTGPVANRQKLDEQFRAFAHLFPPDL